jgi:hypothetical protein
MPPQMEGWVFSGIWICQLLTLDLETFPLAFIWDTCVFIHLSFIPSFYHLFIHPFNRHMLHTYCHKRCERLSAFFSCSTSGSWICLFCACRYVNTYACQKKKTTRKTQHLNSYKHTNKSRTKHPLCLALCIWSFSRDKPMEYELESL